MRSLRARRGSNAVEFALLAPLLITLIMGVFEYGWLTTHQLALASAVSRGVRVGAVDTSANGNVAQVRSAQLAATSFWEASGLSTTGDAHTFTSQIATNAAYASVRVLVASGTVDYTPLTNGIIPLPLNGSNRVTLHAASMAYVEP